MIKHAIESMVSFGESENICCIYPTAPLLKAEYLSASFEVIKGNDVDYVVPVTDYPYPIQRALRLGKSQSISMIDETAYERRSQDLDKCYHDIGQFYWGKKNAWCAGLPILKSSSLGFKIPRQHTIDIDTPEDWVIAERMFSVAT